MKQTVPITLVCIHFIKFPEKIQSVFTSDDYAFTQIPRHFSGIATDLATEKTILIIQGDQVAHSLLKYKSLH